MQRWNEGEVAEGEREKQRKILRPAMGNSLRCWLACVLPCGALDVIRIVHLDGNLEEITHPITAGEVLKNNPNHVLTKPCSREMSSSRRVLIISPESDLKRGSIYFLIPESSLPRGRGETEKGVKKKSSKKSKKCSSSEDDESDRCRVSSSESLSAEKKVSRRDRRKRQVEVWRPHLGIISEDS